MADRVNLTDKKIRATKAAHAGQRLMIWDAKVPGLALRVTDKGTKSFLVMRRIKGEAKPVRRTVGTYPEKSLAAAREKALAWIEVMDTGNDPYKEEDRELRERKRAKAKTVSALFEKFDKAHLSILKSGAEVSKAMRDDVIPQWGDRSVGNISRSEVVDLLEEIVDRRGPISANRRHAAIRKMFNFALKRGDIDINPAAFLDPPGGNEKGRKRDRVLDESEIRAVWKAAEKMGMPFGPIISLMLLTGQRRNEIAEMRWSEIDNDKRLWLVPAARTKARRAQLLPLSELGFRIIDEAPKFEKCDFVFTTTGETAVSGYSRAKRQLEKYAAKILAGEGGEENDEAPPIPHFTFHDLRRTVGTRMASIGISREHRARVLNHAEQGVTDTTYNEYDYLSEKRRALMAWERHLCEIIEARPVKNVVELRPGT